MKVVSVIDSFKGCASSSELSSWVREAILEVFPDASVHSCMIADGGEGMIDALLANVEGTRLTCQVHDPLMREIEAHYAILKDGTTAVIEMAQAAGLPLVQASQRNPLLTTTYGVGELIHDALARGCKKVIIGLGGSATNDAGIGMLHALGFRFLDREGRVLFQGGEVLEKIHTIDRSGALNALKSCEFIAACDVENPMIGVNGSARVYAAQKGADALMIERLESGMQHFAQRLERALGHDVASQKGSGAAGGIAGGLHAFLNARLASGIEILLDEMRFDALIEDADLVISGEGRIDAQSLMGKVLSGVAKRCQKAHVPLIALGGGIDDALEEHVGIDALFSIMRYPMRLDEAMDKANAQKLTRQSVKEIFRLIQAVRRK